MNWEHLIWFAVAAAICWVTGAVMALRNAKAWRAAVV